MGAHVTEQTELKIVQAASAGDQDAIRDLYRLYAGPIHRCVRRVVRDEHEAEDLTQEVFLKLLRVLPRFNPCGRPFKSWALRVARNAALDHVRASRGSFDELAAAAAAHMTEMVDLDRRSDLLDALRELPGEQRAVVVLRHLVGLSPDEVAGRIGRSCAAVHSLDHRARVSLRRDLVQSSCAPAVLRAA